MQFWAYGMIYCQKLEFLYDGFVATALITIQIIEQTLIKVNHDSSVDTGGLQQKVLLV